MKYFLFIIKSSIFDFTRNKVRTFLTSLGILIGVSAVILLLAFGLGLRVYIQEQFANLGSNLVYVLPGALGNGGSFGPASLGGTRFNDTDLTNLEKIKEAVAIVGVFTKSVSVSGGGESKVTTLLAANSEIFPVRNFEIDLGRLFDKADENKAAKVVVIGPKIASQLYTSTDAALGRTLKIEDQAYRIIGILKSKGGGGFGGPDIDSYIFIPYTSAIQFNPSKQFITFYLKASSEEAIPALKDKIKSVMLKHYKTDDFSVVEQTEILSTVTSIFAVINLILVAIGAISLVVGGVGIMNIMYVSVTERIKEIGIRRAVGARRRDILFQFLAESVILSLFGGLAGLLISSVIVLVIRRFFPATIDPTAVFVAIGVSSAVGVIFGVFPAKKAADLSPIDAIRYE